MYLRWAIWRGGHFLAWTHFVELNISRCFFANQNLLAEDEETITIGLMEGSITLHVVNRQLKVNKQLRNSKFSFQTSLL